MILDIRCISNFAIENLTMKSTHQLGGDPVFCLQILLVDDLTMSDVNDWHSRLTPLALLFIEGNGSAWFSCGRLNAIH